MVKKHYCNKEEEISEIHKTLMTMVKQQAKNDVKINAMHKALMGNGRPGLIEKWNQLEGTLLTFKFIASVGGLSGLFALIISLLA